MTAPAGIVSTGYTPRPWQAEVHRKSKRFSVYVVHRRAGKSVAAVNILLAAALKKPNARLAYVAPFVSQARRIAWPYVKQFSRPIPGTSYNETLASATLANGSTIALYGADRPDSLRGIGLDGVVLDELADMRPQTWGEILRPTLADRRGWAVFVGTAKGLNLLSQVFYHGLRDAEWYATRLTYADTAALPVEEIEAARREMTEAQFRQEFECDFEAGTEDTLISVDVARAAAERVLPPNIYSHSPRTLGVDVARFGSDFTVIAKRQGLAVHGHHCLRGLDTMEVAAQVAMRADVWQPDAIFVDVGGVGAGVCDRLIQLRHSVTPVDFGGRPDDPRFANKRAEIWWRLAEWLAHADIPNDERFIAELCSARYSYANSAGKFQLESKDSLRKRGVPSPDIADAYATTFAHPVSPRGLRAGAGRAKCEYDPWADRS